MFQLTSDERHIIQVSEAKMQAQHIAMEKARQFKLGDYLIAFTRDYRNNINQVLTGYNTPQKWVLYAVDSFECGYVKALNSEGKPTGEMLSLTKINSVGQQWFELDPDFVNSIIMGDGQDFDPVEKQKYNKSLRKLIVEHNKNARIRFDNIKELDQFMRTDMNVGDVIWISLKKNFVITNKELDPIDKVPHGRYHCKGWSNAVRIDVRFSNGEVGAFYPTMLSNRNIYRTQPRTYKELSDSI